MKKVLIPTDFSDNAWDALTYAIRLYDDIPCCFYILNTFLVGASRTSNIKSRARNTHIYQLMKEESELGLKEIKDHLEKHLLNDKHQYKTLSRSGTLTDVVGSLVEKEGFDLLVMGTTGASGPKEFFMGSNTVHVIKHVAKCAILSVPNKYEYNEIQRALFATDFKHDFKKEDLKCLIELQLIHNFKINIVHIKQEDELSDVQMQNKDYLQSCLGDCTFEFRELISDNGIATTLDQFAIAENINLICLLNYEHNFIEMITHEAVIKNISFHSDKPLLILPVK